MFSIYYKATRWSFCNIFFFLFFSDVRIRFLPLLFFCLYHFSSYWNISVWTSAWSEKNIIFQNKIFISQKHFISQTHSFFQSQIWKHQNNVWNRFKVNNKDLRNDTNDSWSEISIHLWKFIAFAVTYTLFRFNPIEWCKLSIINSDIVTCNATFNPLSACPTKWSNTLK